MYDARAPRPAARPGRAGGLGCRRAGPSAGRRAGRWSARCSCCVGVAAAWLGSAPARVARPGQQPTGSVDRAGSGGRSWSSLVGCRGVRQSPACARRRSSAGPLDELARDGAFVSVDAVVTSDPVARQGTFAPYSLVAAAGRAGRRLGTRHRTSGRRCWPSRDPSWLGLQLGAASSAASGRLQPAQGPDLAAVAARPTPPEVTRSRVVGAARRRRGAQRAARRGRRRCRRPSRRWSRPWSTATTRRCRTDVVLDFQTTGLTHLLAVSGSNLTLVLAFVLVVGRWLGVRGRGTAVRRAGGGRVLRAAGPPRAERASGRRDGRGRARRAVGGRTAPRDPRALRRRVVLVLLDPWLARSVGFLLSTIGDRGHPAAGSRLARPARPAGCRGCWRRRSPCRWPRSSRARRRSPRSPARSRWSRSQPTSWRHRRSARRRCSASIAGLVALLERPRGSAGRAARRRSRVVDRHGRAARRRLRRGEPRLGGRAAGAGGAHAALRRRWWS